jgi:hypothetical protein
MPYSSESRCIRRFQWGGFGHGKRIAPWTTVGHRSPLYLSYQRNSLRAITWFYDTWNCQIASAACMPDACGTSNHIYVPSSQ